ncbi:MAG TPA: TlpA disulfide reductase family protein [Terriglobales bacterium]|jgi:thiol-disulfide isomerase/thioredoxin|nr:TlpA disulfide reductase family protein [Terriglobales bacterium]
MRYAKILLVLICFATPALSQEASEGPTDAKAQATYKKALAHLQKHETLAALDDFKKADKQDGGHCSGCQKGMVKYGIELQEWKTAQAGAEELIAEAQGDKYIAVAHYQLGVVIMKEALLKNKQELFARAHDEMSKALTAYANFPGAIFGDGKALAHLNRDEEAKKRFELVVKILPEGDLDRQRALRYLAKPELARARMAPPFSVVTTDGQHISMDDLTGKVVLIDFWATWCGPCKAALPHMRDIVKKFQGQPLLVLSVSVDDDEAKWRKFIAENGMTWSQYFDGGFTGPIARIFAVHAIPQTFTIDVDGVLQDQHIGDASIESKLKKLVAQAQELGGANKTMQ